MEPDDVLLLVMKTYSRAALVSYDSGAFNTTQYLGKISEGVYFLPLGGKSKLELSEHLQLLSEGRMIMIWVDYSLLSHRPGRERNNEYYHLIQKVNTFCKIYIASHVGIIRPSQYKNTYIEASVENTKVSMLAPKWQKFSDSYDKYKLLYRLFTVSTIDNSDYIFNIMNSTIALESILLRGEKTENAYKFRMRGAFLIGRSFESRKKFHQIFKFAYDMRSAIVHANDKEKTRIRDKIKADLNLSMKEFNEELIKLNRILLQQMIETPDIYDDLDIIVLEARS